MNLKYYFLTSLLLCLNISCHTLKITDLFKISKNYGCYRMSSYLDSTSIEDRLHLVNRINFLFDSLNLKEKNIYNLRFMTVDSSYSLTIYESSSLKNVNYYILHIKGKEVVLISRGFTTGVRNRKENLVKERNRRYKKAKK